MYIHRKTSKTSKKSGHFLEQVRSEYMQNRLVLVQPKPNINLLDPYSASIFGGVSRSTGLLLGYLWSVYPQKRGVFWKK